MSDDEDDTVQLTPKEAISIAIVGLVDARIEQVLWNMQLISCPQVDPAQMVDFNQNMLIEAVDKLGR